MTENSSPIQDRQSALDFLFGRIDYERTRTVPYRSRRFKLNRMRKLAKLLGHPERDYPAIHIAGTKGKGSTACMIAAVFSDAGLRTGLYTSPHLYRLEERFAVDGDLCTEQELVSLLADIEPVVRALDDEAQKSEELQGPTYFEITTAAALLHFRRKKVDCAVLEVGLGGRLDSTNICHPAVSVITTISLDHTRQLGKKLSQIAREKAGIIKPATPIVTGVRDAEPLEVITEIAAESGSPLLTAGRDFGFRYRRQSQTEPGDSAFDCQFDYWSQAEPQACCYNQLHLGMLGQHQAANAAVALATLQQLQRLGWQIDERAIRTGLRRARCPARFEIVRRAPAIILDAAHNPASVTALTNVLNEHFGTRPRVLIFASSVDKDVREMLARLLPHFQHIILTRYMNNPRALDPQKALEIATKLAAQQKWAQPRMEMCETPDAAWQRSQALARSEHVVCVTGSFFLAAEIREQLERIDHDPTGLKMP